MRPARPMALRTAEATTVGILVILYLVGLAAHLAAATRPLVIALTPAVLLACGAAVFLVTLTAETGRRGVLLFWFGGVMLVTLLVEVIGVATGRVFGVYRYGAVLGWKLAGVPFVIGFNWALTVLAAVVIADRTVGSISPSRRRAGFVPGREAVDPRRPRLRTILAIDAFRTLLHLLLTGLVAALFDFVLEPSAVSLGYWSWQGGVVPPRNYAAWFFLAAGAALPYRLSGLRVRSGLPALYLALQCFFFITLDVGIPAIVP